MKAPQKPTVVSTNPVHGKHIIQFAPELTDYIAEKGKVKTYRFGDKYKHLQKGDVVELREYKTNKLISKAEIIGTEKTTFKNIPLDLEGHEVYKSKKHQRRVFSSYYKYIGREIEDNDPFLILSFKLL